ncbi:MAG TPA: hypothetical protein VGO21_01285, partial [Candidatus Paceibacterota bacterium]|nr:hypothetical protein [Candidatus Paceibacterota bacterium]
PLRIVYLVLSAVLETVLLFGLPVLLPTMLEPGLGQVLAVAFVQFLAIIFFWKVFQHEMTEVFMFFFPVPKNHHIRIAISQKI